MRRTVVNTLVLALALAGVSIALGQQTAAPPAKEEDTPKAKTSASQSQLEQMLAQALKNNPDIRVAATKASLAEAELHRTRLQVTQEVVRLHAALATQRATVNYKAKQLQRYQELLRERSIDARLVDEKQDDLLAAKAKLAELETQLEALLGKPSHGADARDEATRQRAVEALERLQRANELSTAERLQRANELSTAEAFYRQILEQYKPAGPMAERIRTALEKPVKVNFKELAFADLLKELEKMAPGITFRDWMTPYKDKPTITLRFDDPVPLSTLLQAIEDYYVPGTVLHGIRFVVRDYGLLVCHQMHLPPGAVTVQEFLRQKAAEDPKKGPNDYQRTGLSWNPPDKVEGTVKEVDGRGVIAITLENESGLLEGHTLDLFRPADKSTAAKYLGTIRIWKIKGKEAIAQPNGRLLEAPKVGDKVSSPREKK